MPLLVENNSKYPLDEIISLLNQVDVPLNVADEVEVHIKNSRKHPYTGHIYYNAHNNSWCRTKRRFLITIGVGAENKFPYSQIEKRFKGSQNVTLQNWREAIVYVFAHEICHLNQFLSSTKRSEVEADCKAYQKLQSYRSGR